MVAVRQSRGEGLGVRGRLAALGQSWVGARSLLSCCAAAGSVSTPGLLAADAVGVRGAAAFYE